MAVGQFFQVGAAGHQVMRRTALRDQQAQRLLVGQRTVRLVHITLEQSFHLGKRPAIPDPHAIANAVDFAKAALGRQRYGIEVIDDDLAPRFHGVLAILVRAQAGRNHLQQFILHGTGAAVFRMAVFFDLRGQGAAATTAVAAEQVQRLVEDGLAQAVPFHGRVTLGRTRVEQFAVFDEQQALHQRGRRVGKAVEHALGIAGREQGRGAAIEDGQSGAVFLVIRGKDAPVDQLHHLRRHARLRRDGIVARIQLGDEVRQAGIAEALIVWAVLRIADGARRRGAWLDLERQLAVQTREKLGLQGRGTHFAHDEPRHAGDQRQHDDGKDGPDARTALLRRARRRRRLGSWIRGGPLLRGQVDACVFHGMLG